MDIIHCLIFTDLMNPISHRIVGIHSTIDYYPFGMEMPGRIKGDTSYRFGFNGQMQDNEFAGKDGAHNTAEFWEYDCRIGRRWNRDPIVKPWESPYACFANNPIFYKDPSGLNPEGNGDKYKARCEKKLEKRIYSKLEKLRRNNGTPQEIEILAHQLSDKYQNKEWFRYTGTGGYDNEGKGYESTSTTPSGMKRTHQKRIEVVAYSTEKDDFEMTGDKSTTPNNVESQTLIDAKEGDVLKVSFDPLLQPDGLDVYSSNGTNRQTVASTNGEISPLSTPATYNSGDITITKANAGQISFKVTNTSERADMPDNWNLQISLTRAVFKPHVITTNVYNSKNLFFD